MPVNQYVTVCSGDAECLCQLAEAGRSMADESGRRLRMLLFADRRQPCADRAQLLESVFDCAKRLDAEMNVYYTARPVERLMADGPECLVVSGADRLGGRLRRLLPEKRLVVME